LSSVANLLSETREKHLKSVLAEIPIKVRGAEAKPSKQALSCDLLFDHKSQLDFKAFSTELLTRQHNADGILFAALFIDERERFQLFRAFLKQQGYAEACQGCSPLFTLLSVMTGGLDELFEPLYLAQMLPQWQLHCQLLFKSLVSGQSSVKFLLAKEFVSRLA